MRTATRWWRTWSLALALTAATLPWAARAIAGPPGAIVHVRWAASLVDAPRRSLETRFQLADPQRIDDRTWRYDLLDPSDENIRALLSESAIVDTHYIDRPLATLDVSAPRTGRRGRTAYGDTVVSIADGTAWGLFAVAGLLVLLGAAGRADTPADLRRHVVGAAGAAAGGVHTALSSVGRHLGRGIPMLDARTAGAFRIVFGAALLWFFASRPVDSAVLSSMFEPLIQDDTHAAVMSWLLDHPSAVDRLTPWLLVTGLAFTAGLFTRTMFTLFVAGALVWAFAAVAIDSTHPHSTLVLAMLALLPSRWGDALSVDAWRRGTRGLPPGRMYGYSVWVPGLIFGVAFAAAAWAKLAPNGVSWVLNGTVKYHFVADSGNAVVDWGLQAAAHPYLAVLASLSAVAVEALVITAAFTRSERYRLMVGVAALALLAGFWLFMGVFWPGWWILLLGFLPWRALTRQTGGVADAAGVTAGQTAAILFVLLQQVIVSALVVERAPIFSNYPMYATTYASPEAFNASQPVTYRIVVVTGADRVAISCNPSEDLVDEFRAALQGSREAAARVTRAVYGCRPDLASAAGIVFEEYRRVFDWERLTFTSTPPVVIGMLKTSPTAAASTRH